MLFNSIFMHFIYFPCATDIKHLKEHWQLFFVSCFVLFCLFIVAKI